MLKKTRKKCLFCLNSTQNYKKKKKKKSEKKAQNQAFFSKK